MTGSAFCALTSDGNGMRINGTSDQVASEEELDIRDGFRFSPDGKSIAYWQFDTTGVGRFTLVNDTAETYPTLKQFPYPVTETQIPPVLHRACPVPNGGTSTCRDRPAMETRMTSTLDAAWPEPENSQELVLEKLNRLQNTNDVILADVESGLLLTLFFQDTDLALGRWWSISLDWINGGKGLLWLSERDGQGAHAYRESTDPSGKAAPHYLSRASRCDRENSRRLPAEMVLLHCFSGKRDRDVICIAARLDGKSAP